MRSCLFLLFPILLSNAVIAQSFYRSYGTQRVQARLQKEHPEVAAARSKLERDIASFKQKGEFQKVTIPVVFHILYAPGQPIPTEEQANAQIDALNRDFGQEDYKPQQKADTVERFYKAVAKAELEFCLPKVGPDGKKAVGIRFIPVKTTEWLDDDAIKSAAKGGVDPWNTDQYLNVWVANLANGLSGYAQMPGGPSATDGIVIDYRFFGMKGTARAPYDKGKTLTHLVGSYLNLYELWNELEPCADDYVTDTPVHNAPNFGKALYKHVSTCPGNPVEMTMNLMDNSDDEGLYMFTIGQKQRLQSTFAPGGPRANLGAAKTKCDGGNSNLAIDAPPSLPTQSALPSNPTQPVIHLFPNPAGDRFTLDVTCMQNSRLDVVVYSSLGNIMKVIKQDFFAGSQQFSIESNEWPTGIYFIRTQINDQIDLQRIEIIK